MADQTIVNYEIVEKYSKEFDNQAEILAESINGLKNKAQGLESFWVGKAADKFFDEFYQDVLPATGRLHAALLAGAETLRKIINLYETSDQECADYFSESALDNGMSGVEVGGGGGGGSSASQQSQGMEGNLRMGVAASGQGTASPGSGEGSNSGGMADHIYESGASSAGPTTAAASQPTGGGESQPADSNNIPKAAGGIAGAAAAGAAAKRKKDSKDEQE